jgi:hypothetical protein
MNIRCSDCGDKKVVMWLGCGHGYCDVCSYSKFDQDETDVMCGALVDGFSREICTFIVPGLGREWRDNPSYFLKF